MPDNRGDPVEDALLNWEPVEYIPISNVRALDLPAQLNTTTGISYHPYGYKHMRSMGHAAGRVSVACKFVWAYSLIGTLTENRIITCTNDMFPVITRLHL